MTMDIEAMLASRAALVEKELEALSAESDPDYGIVCDAMRYSLLSGGKRLRPFLAIEFASLASRASGTDPARADKCALRFGVALEMIHTYSLIHDDLPCMDNDDLRRGKPTCHVKYGEANALLAGDALLTKAFGVAAGNPFAEPETIMRAVSLMSRCAGIDGMIGGQVMDLESENKEIGLASLEKLQSLKTGELIRCAALLGCLSGNAPETLNRAAERYADGIGRAFQVIDDILDVTGDEKTFGKPTGSDAASGKNTFATLMTIDEAREYAASVTSDAVSAIKGFDGSEQLSSLAGWLLERKK